MTQPFRLAKGGRIDRAKTLQFTFDGLRYEGVAGDTLASALLANGVRLVGRSFKYHRPRGIFTAGYEEPNALVELRDGTRREPNTRATVAELYDGLIAESQNRWPSLAWDVAAINGRLARFMPAGFYYKTFMWPASFWEKVYEPAIRRAAGLGRAAMEPDPDTYEPRHANCDVLVVGAGAAGLAAARAVAEAGARVILAEQDFELGGGLLSAPGHEAWRASEVAALQGHADVTLLPRTTVFGLYDHGVAGAIERVGDHLLEPPEHGVRQRYWMIRGRQIVLATGAIERLVAFPDNDRPGIMLAGAVETYVRRFAVAPGRRAVVFANNDDAYEAAYALQEAGVEIAAIVDVRPHAIAADIARGALINVVTDAEVIGTQGKRALSRVAVRRRSDGGFKAFEADLLCISGGWSPAVNLASMAGEKMTWDSALAAFVPRDTLTAVRSVGAARGVFGVHTAGEDGRAAGRAVARSLGLKAAGDGGGTPQADERQTPLQPVWEVRGKGKAFVDLQNDATADDIRLAHQEGFTHIEHAKRYTTHAMATDQGKTGGLVGAAVLAAARGEPVEKVGVPTYRPYVTPIAFGAIAGHDVGRHLKPTRRTLLHRWHEQTGAVFMEAGIWLRPAYYSAAHETGWEPILREARAVRRAVGLCDVSTLGKIDIQGKDAAKFLDRVYTNTFSTLPIGKCRYGLMLREDGLLFDDGTTTRLGSNHFLMTTTTAKASDVLGHLEFCAQVLWPKLDVRFCSVSDQWAQMALTGPRARDVLARVIDGLDVSNAGLPYMGYGEGRIAGVPVRVFRVSFSGELGYEIAAPGGYGVKVWSAIHEAGRPFDLVPYGLEALNVLRVEKGHVTGAEINGQTTARDLGFEKMMKKTGDYIGRVNAERRGLVDPLRPRLVGIRAVGTFFGRRLRAGAHIVDQPRSSVSLGWVSSVTQSVELGRWIGLALVREGDKRIGERLFAAYPLKDEIVEVEITSPHHVDPENTRVRS
jgi:methylglutamate dehydrogenase subunit C